MGSDGLDMSSEKIAGAFGMPRALRTSWSICCTEPAGLAAIAFNLLLTLPTKDVIFWTKMPVAAEPLIVHAGLLAPEPIPLFLFKEAR